MSMIFQVMKWWRRRCEQSAHSDAIFPAFLPAPVAEIIYTASVQSREMLAEEPRETSAGRSIDSHWFAVKLLEGDALSDGMIGEVVRRRIVSFKDRIEQAEDEETAWWLPSTR